MALRTSEPYLPSLYENAAIATSPARKLRKTETAWKSTSDCSSAPAAITMTAVRTVYTAIPQKGVW